MKKRICFLIAVMMLIGNVAFAQTDTKAELCVSGLGIMRADETGDFHWGDTVTRAEFTTIATRLLRIDDASAQQQETPFVDVPQDHWASGYVKYAADLGLVSGTGNGNFSPEDPIRLNEVMKILIHILGYDVPAQQMGGYPQGYIALAGNLGLYKQVKQEEETLSRGEIAQVIYNAMDIVPLERNYGTNEVIRNDSGKTLYELLTEHSDIVRISGIVMETEFSSLRKPVPDMESGYIVIGNVKYKTKVNLNEYLGYYVEGYTRLDTADDLYEIVKISPAKNRNELTVIDSEDAVVSANSIEQVKDGRTERYPLDANVQYLYNGRYVTMPTEEEKQANYGEYRLLDNNGDGAIDVVFVQNSESFIVERVNTDNNTIYLANKALFRGKNGFKFDYEEKGNLYELVNTDGDTIELKDVAPGNGITIMATRDETYAKVVISRQQVTGKVEEILDENTVTVAGQTYKVANNPENLTSVDIDLGDEATYVLDMFGNIIGMYGDKKRSYNYGYIVDAGMSGTMSTNAQLRIVTGLTPEKEVKTTAGNEKISYYFQNDMIQLYDCASKVEWNGVSKTLSAAEAASLKGKIIAYSTDASGQIKKMLTYDIPTLSKSYNFNGKIVSFGGSSVSRGYATNSETKVICVPDVADEDDDYYVRLKLADGATGNKVFGVNVFPAPVSSALSPADELEQLNAQPVNVLIIQDAMDASRPQPIQSGADICIVGNVTSSVGTIMDDEGSSVYKLELLNGEKRITEVTKASGDGYTVAAGLRKGDLIQYTKDGFNRVINIKKLASVQGLSEYGEIYTDAGEGMYGLAYDINLDTYDYMTNQEIDRLALYFGEGEEIKKVRIYHEDGQPIYLYERSSGYIYPATADDITAYSQVGSKASKIYAQMEDNDATVIIIIED